METLLEQQRRYHEERERLLDAMVGEQTVKKNTHREHLNSSHRQRAMLDRYSEATGLLRDIYEDKDGQRKEEVAALSGPNEFAEFYSRLKQVSASSTIILQNVRNHSAHTLEGFFISNRFFGQPQVA